MASPLLRWHLLLYVFANISITIAHKHASDVDVFSEENKTKPIDWVLWLHIVFQGLIWGFVFPIGMVLGLARSRWHVPIQATTIVLTLGGFLLGHVHKGRQFPHMIHNIFANVVLAALVAQGSFGIYLKLHIHEKSIRPFFVIVHGLLGKFWPILGWTQMLFGAMSLRTYCLDDNVGQCAAHYTMGSAFIGYGILMVIVMYVQGASEWLRRTGKSQEWFDSWVIMLWGIVNTFSLHRGPIFGPWSHKDLQHAMIGVTWWTGGMLGIYLSRGGRRSLVPAIIVMLTGWTMGSHAQGMSMSTKVHSTFGAVLIIAGIVRIIEICFILGDKNPGSEPSGLIEDDEDGYSVPGPSIRGTNVVRGFQHLPPYLLMAGGLLLMSATDEELEYVDSLDIDYVTYTLIMFSLAFFIYLYALFLINLYLTSGRNAPPSDSSILRSRKGSITKNWKPFWSSGRSIDGEIRLSLGDGARRSHPDQEDLELRTDERRDKF